MVWQKEDEYMDMMDFVAILGFAITCFSLGVVYGKDHRDEK